MRSGVVFLLLVSALSFTSSAVAAVVWPQSGMVAVGSGKWGSTLWTFGASEPGGGIYCIAVAVNGHARTSSCGSTQHLDGLRFGETAGTSIARPYLHGAVTSAASEVTVTLSDGKAIRTAILAPPRGFSPAVSFFVAPVPCGASRAFVTALVARGSTGQIVARRTLTTPLHLATC